MSETQAKYSNLHPLHRLDGCMNTLSGKKFNLLDPKADTIDISDIAHGLAFKGHFAGQTPCYFSIAQHSLLALHNLVQSWREENKQLALAILLHDAAEAYIGDMIKPIKILIPYFSEIEDRIMDQVAIRFNIDRNLFRSDVVKQCDKLAQEQEFETFYNGSHRYIKTYLSPDLARVEFLCQFYELTK